MHFLSALSLVALASTTITDVLAADTVAVCDKRNTYDVSSLPDGDRYVFTSHDEFGAGTTYDPDVKCIRKFHKGSCETLSITCDAFHLINGDERKCRSGDNVLFNNKEDVKIRVCGETIEPIETSANADLKVTFSSDANDEAGGFRCFASCQGSTAPPPPVDDGTCYCGRAMPELANGRIIGGEETGVSEFPWQAGIVSAGDTSPFCGGTVIGDRWILSAAHCFTDPTVQPRRVQVALGDHDHTTRDETNEIFADVERIIVHDDYDSDTTNNDYALIELKNPIDFSANPHIRPACLPDNDIVDGRDATVSGWGDTDRRDNRDRFPDVLHSVEVPVITRDECQNALGRFGVEVTTKMICAGNVRDGGVDSCQGDSGGPLVQDDGNGNFEIQGVVSFGFGCADAGFPGVYASVKAEERWISRTTGLNGGECPKME